MPRRGGRVDSRFFFVPGAFGVGVLGSGQEAELGPRTRERFDLYEALSDDDPSLDRSMGGPDG